MLRLHDDKSIIMMPIETMTREWEYRVFMATHCASPDRRILVGHHQALLDILPTISGGVYLGKNVFDPTHEARRDTRKYRALKERGVHLVYHDEEGGVYAGREKDWRKTLDSRIWPDLLDPRDRLCVWGDFQRDHYKSEQKDSSVPVVTTGHPKFDIYKEPYRRFFEDRQTKLRNQYGDFILVNLSFSAANHMWGVGYIFSPQLGYSPQDPARVTNLFLNQRRRTSDFIEIISDCAIKFPDLTFVVRPHPSEDRKFYRRVFAGRENIVVRNDGSVGGWLSACRAMLHSGCTTGIEAYLMGVPIINYRPAGTEWSEVYLADLFGHRVATTSEVKDLITQSHRHDLEPDSGAVPDRAVQLLKNLRDTTFELLHEQIREVENEVHTSKSPAELRVQLDEAPRTVMKELKKVVRPLFPKRMEMYERNRRRWQFHDFEFDSVRYDFQRAAQILNKTVRVSKLSPRLISVESGS